MWLISTGTRADVGVILEPLDATLIVKGTYRLQISLSMDVVDAEAMFLKDAEQRFWGTSRELEVEVPTVRCVQANQHLGQRISQLDGKTALIKQILGGKTRRGVWSALGAMDSSDRGRIDYDLDRLRANENELEHGMQHQTDVAAETYKLVNSSVLHLDKNMIEIREELDNIRQEVSSCLNFTHDRI